MACCSFSSLDKGLASSAFSLSLTEGGPLDGPVPPMAIMSLSPDCTDCPERADWMDTPPADSGEGRGGLAVAESSRLSLTCSKLS